MKIKIAKDYFLANCSLKGLAYRSIDNYSNFIDNYIKFVGNIDLSELNYLQVSEYIRFLYSRNLSLATVGTYIRHLKIFIRWLEKEYGIDSFVDKIKVPRLPKKLVDIYSDEQIKQIFDDINIEPDWLRYRNCSLIALMLDSGLRLNEVCSINLVDLDFKTNLLKVHGKGNKERIVPIGKMTQYFIRLYLKELPKKMDGNVWLFNTVSGRRLTRNSVKLLVQKLSRSLDFNFSCHKLRHNFATNYCLDEYNQKGTIDIYKLMILLGHEDIQTTRRYLHLANQIIVSKSTASHLDGIYSRYSDGTKN